MHIVVIGDVHTVPNTFGTRRRNSLAYMPAQMLWWHQTHGQFPCVQSNACALLGKLTTNLCNKIHMLTVVTQRNQVIFRGDKVQAHNALVRCNQLKGNQRLGVYLGWRQSTNNLTQVAHCDIAARPCLQRCGTEFLIAVLQLSSSRVNLIHLLNDVVNDGVDGLVVYALAIGSIKIRRCLRQGRHLKHAQAMHKFQVENILPRGSATDFGHHVASPTPGGRREKLKGREKLIVARHLSTAVIAHRKLIDHRLDAGIGCDVF